MSSLLPTTKKNKAHKSNLPSCKENRWSSEDVTYLTYLVKEKGAGIAECRGLFKDKTDAAIGAKIWRIKKDNGVLTRPHHLTGRYSKKKTKVLSSSPPVETPALLSPPAPSEVLAPLANTTPAEEKKKVLVLSLPSNIPDMMELRIKFVDENKE